ncbi:MAG TPA: phosphatase PAP2 family protein [bacterium]|nr:phosphatase PAP2 family protein [bacterium]
MLKIRLPYFLLAAFFLLFPLALGAEPFRSPDPDTSLAHFPAKCLDDLPNLLAPENIPVLGVGAVLTAGDWVFFDPQNAIAQDLRDWDTPGLFDFGNFYGEGWVEGGTAVGGWGLGALTDDPRLQEFGRDAGESLLMATVVVTVLKYPVGRERPDGSNAFSFPSGHSITAFCFAPVVAQYGGWELGVPAYALATVTALARVEGYHHYLSDVIGGATLGILIGQAVVHRPKDLQLGLAPGAFQVTWRFD